MLQGTIDGLAAVLPCVWRADSAWIDDWDAANPARGQCGSTALVVQDFCGGELIAGRVCLSPGAGPDQWIVHYWNRIAGERVDLTWEQFPPSARVAHGAPVLRATLLRTPWFVRRYHALYERVARALGYEATGKRWSAASTSSIVIASRPGSGSDPWGSPRVPFHSA